MEGEAEERKGRRDGGEREEEGGEVCSMSPLSVIVLTGGSKPGLFSCHKQTHTHMHAHSTCVCVTDSSFITINQLQPPPVCLSPPTVGGKGGELERERRGGKKQKNAIKKREREKEKQS